VPPRWELPFACRRPAPIVETLRRPYAWIIAKWSRSRPLSWRLALVTQGGALQMQVKASLPGIGGIVDITETGSSLVANKLRVRSHGCPGWLAVRVLMQIGDAARDRLSAERAQGISSKAGSSIPALRDGAQIVDTILSSTTRLVANKAAWEDPQKRRKIEDVALLLKAWRCAFCFILSFLQPVPTVNRHC
jgi:hypothetical protein